LGILDAALHVGNEGTYGTAASLTRSFEAKTEDWKREQQRIESVGFRAGMQTVRTDRVARSTWAAGASSASTCSARASDGAVALAGDGSGRPAACIRWSSDGQGGFVEGSGDS
jgi:hypothetical protein